MKRPSAWAASVLLVALTARPAATLATAALVLALAVLVLALAVLAHVAV